MLPILERNQGALSLLALALALFAFLVENRRANQARHETLTAGLEAERRDRERAVTMELRRIDALVGTVEGISASIVEEVAQDGARQRSGLGTSSLKAETLRDLLRTAPFEPEMIVAMHDVIVIVEEIGVVCDRLMERHAVPQFANKMLKRLEIAVARLRAAGDSAKQRIAAGLPQSAAADPSDVVPGEPRN
ncbi:MAG: hypothetical protein ACOVOE_00840 [Caulobacter sp.]